MIFKLVACCIIVYFYLDYYEARRVRDSFNREIQLTTMDVTFSKNSAIKSFVQFRKYNRTHTAYNYNCSITKVIDKRFRYDLEVEKWGDGGWKKNLIKYRSRDPCAGMKYTLGPNFEDVMTRSGHSKNCPYVPGFYQFTNYCIQATHTPLIFQTGTYRVVINIYDEQIWNLKLVIVVNINDIYY